MKQQINMAQMDELEWIQHRRKCVIDEMRHTRTNMQGIYSNLTKKEEIPLDKWGKTAYLLSKSGTIVNGLRIGIKVGRAVNTIVKLKQAFSSRKK